MCGRASLTASAEELEDAFALDEPVPELSPRYNIAPSQPILVVREEEGRRAARFLRWGLTRPSEARPSRPLINLQAESAARGALKSSLQDRRCLVPMTGFYEWRRTGKHSQPYNIRRRDGKPFAVAGLWASGRRGSEPLETCVVLTTAANDVVRPIHGRMPLIVDATSYDAWLRSGPHDARDVLAQVKAIPAEALEAYPVSPLVNRATVEDQQCLAPAKDGSLY